MARKTRDKRLEKLYSEVFQCGDKYKQRAICEVMTSMQGKSSDPDVRMVLNRYEQQAKQDIEKVRTTPDIEKAEQEAQTDWENYGAARQELIRTAQDIGEGEPYASIGRRSIYPGDQAGADHRITK